MKLKIFFSFFFFLFFIFLFAEEYLILSPEQILSSLQNSDDNAKIKYLDELYKFELNENNLLQLLNSIDFKNNQIIFLIKKIFIKNSKNIEKLCEIIFFEKFNNDLIRERNIISFIELLKGINLNKSQTENIKTLLKLFIELEKNSYLKELSLNYLKDKFSDDDIDYLIEIFNEEKNENLKLQLIDILNKINNIKTLNFLIGLSYNTNKKIKEKVITILANKNDKILIIPLLNALDDTDELIIQNAIYGLKKYKTNLAFEKILKFLNHPNLIIQQEAIYCIGNFENDTALIKLLELYVSNNNQEIQKTIENVIKQNNYFTLQKIEKIKFSLFEKNQIILENLIKNIYQYKNL